MSKLSNEQILSNIYYDLERGYGGAKSLFEQATEEGAVITVEEVKNFMKKQPNKQIKGYQNYTSYLVPYARAEFQVDIMDMNKFKEEGEERYAWILIDAFSRYAYIHPMKDKNSEDVLEALKAAFKVMGEPIEIISGEEAALLLTYLDELRIVQKTTRTHAHIVERLKITIKKGVADRIPLQKETGQIYTNQHWKI